MNGSDLPNNLVRPAFERVQQVEHAVSLLSRVVGLELTDITLNPALLDDTMKAQLRMLGGSLVRMSSLGLTLANDIAASLGEPTAELAQTNTSERLGESLLIPAPNVTTNSPASVATSETETEQTKSITTPVASRPSPVLSRPKPRTDTLVDKPIQDNILTTSVVSRSNVRPAQEKSPRSRQFEGELYEKIVPLTTIPSIELREGMKPIEVRIFADEAIVVEGTKIRLEGDRLFIFNALMRLRQNFIRAREIQELGFRPGTSRSGASQMLSKELALLRIALRDAAGIELVKKVGDKAATKYAVNPAIVLVDERMDIAPLDDTETVKKN